MARFLFVDFSKRFDSKLREKMEQILLANGFHKQTVIDIIMLYKNMKTIVPMTKERFHTKKKKIARSKQYPVKTITNATFADDQALLANTPAQADSEQAARDIDLYVNSDKTKFMCF